MYVFHRPLFTFPLHKASWNAQLAFAAPSLLLLSVTYALSRGYNWARITITVLQPAGFLIAFILLVSSAYRRALFIASGVESLWMLVRLSLVVASVLLLYLRASNAWFNRPRTSRELPPPPNYDY